MKRLAFFTGMLLLASGVFAQTADTLSPARKTGVFPPFKFLLPDSVSAFKKTMLPAKRPVFLMVFNPACDHCKHETEELIGRIEDFRKIEVVMITMAPLAEIRAFVEQYGLAQYKNIVVAQDTQFTLPSFFQMRNFPYLAFYDRNLKLIDTFEGNLPMDKVLAKFGK